MRRKNRLPFLVIRSRKKITHFQGKGVLESNEGNGIISVTRASDVHCLEIMQKPACLPEHR